MPQRDVVVGHLDFGPARIDDEQMFSGPPPANAVAAINATPREHVDRRTKAARFMD
jgi:hypothetical protein